MKQPEFTVGQTVYWETCDSMRGTIVKVVPRIFRETRYKVCWDDSPDTTGTHKERQLTNISWVWQNDVLDIERLRLRNDEAVRSRRFYP
jgi:hypothetical protein